MNPEIEKNIKSRFNAAPVYVQIYSNPEMSFTEGWLTSLFVPLLQQKPQYVVITVNKYKTLKPRKRRDKSWKMNLKKR